MLQRFSNIDRLQISDSYFVSLTGKMAGDTNICTIRHENSSVFLDLFIPSP
jgi:hypothetical protein